MDNWTIVYTTANISTAEIIKGMLLENDILCVAINQKDSEFLFGEIKLYVHPDNTDSANQLINNFNLE